MGNENQIKKKDLIEKTKSRFLPAEIVDIDKDKILYSLDEEFAKTKKNKNLLLYLFILLFIGVVVAGTFFYTDHLKKRDKDIKIDITDFDDLRLKDVLDSARKKGDNADIIAVQLQIFEIKMLDAILEVKENHHNRELSTIVQGMGEKETDAAIKRIRDEEVNAVNGIRQKYAGLIAAKRAELYALEKSKRESEKVVESKEVSNEDRLYKLKTSQLKSVQNEGSRLLKDYADRYSRYVTNRYNPNFKSQELNGVINSKFYEGIKRGGDFENDYRALYKTERTDYNSDYINIRKRIENHDKLVKRLLMIPYINSVYPALQMIDLLSKSIFYEYERDVRRRDGEISNFKYAFDYILNKRPENGYIIDTRNPDNIVIHLYKAYRVKSGETAQVFRDDDDYIGKIQFIMRPSGMRAKVVETSGDKKIMPFDKILFEVKKD